jgi:hypothetical protein
MKRVKALFIVIPHSRVLKIFQLGGGTLRSIGGFCSKPLKPRRKFEKLELWSS